MQPSATGALRVLHLSDTHLTGDGALHQGTVDTSAALDALLDRLEVLDDVGLVVVSGDCSEDGSKASYAHLAERVGGWAERHGAALVVVPGNHDSRETFREVLGSGHLLAEGGVRVARTLERRSPSSPVTGVSTVRGLRVVSVDTSVPGSGWGVVSAPAVDSLRATLADDTTAGARGTMVVMHHPPLPAPSRLHDALRLRDTAPLEETIVGSDTRVILAGHYHHHSGGTFAGVPVLVAPGVANDTDVLQPYGEEAGYVGTGALVVDLLADRGLWWTVVRVPRPGADTEAFHHDAAAVARISDISGRGD